MSFIPVISKPWRVSRGSSIMFCSFFRSLKPGLSLTLFSQLSRYCRKSSSSHYYNDKQISISNVRGYLQSKIFTSFGLSIRILEDIAVFPNQMVTDIETIEKFVESFNKLSRLFSFIPLGHPYSSCDFIAKYLHTK